METTSYRTSGWVGFAAIFLIVVSVWNMILGLTLIFKDNWIVFTEDAVVFLDTSAWGWIILATGVLKLFTGMGLMTGRLWARAVAIGLVVLNMIEQIVLIGAAPWWSLATILVSMAILYALIVPADEYAV